MRFSTSACLLLMAACGTSTPSGTDSKAFSVQSEDVMILPGQEVTYCYYFHTPNTTPIAVDRWVSDMTSGSHHMIFFTGGPDHADGIDMNNDCGLNLSNGVAGLQSWVFASQSEHAEQDLPADDGTGKPLAQVIQPNTQGAFQMHYLNAGPTPLTAHVGLEAYALPDKVEYTPTAPYVTYNFDITIQPHALGTTASASCPAPPGKIWQMTTHAHKQAIDTQVKDGTRVMFESTDWQHPERALWDTAPFYTSQSGNVSWTCTYNNTGDNADKVVSQGPSAAINEMCMAVGYFFPATTTKMCGANGPLTGGPGTCGCL